MFRSSFHIAATVLLALAPLAHAAGADEPSRQHLFHIERSKNANIVQYDALVDADGKLFKKEPVVGYWIRLAEQGQIEELNWVQRTFAYGFSTRLSRDRESAELNMKADVGREINVVRVGDTYRATVDIDGSPAYFDKMYIDAYQKGLSVTVHYVELYGEDMQTGEARYEKFTP